MGQNKKANENMYHSYSHLFEIPINCFRFFTVYGPYGRPDMALFKFVRFDVRKIKKLIFITMEIMKRDFTYISDLIQALV